MAAELTYHQKIRRARSWGNARGYEGRAGGWIYNSAGRPVVQGWAAFYRRHASQIEAAA